MKIAYVTAFYSPAICGVGRVTRELAERAVGAGHDVHVFCADTDKYKRLEKKEEVINGVKVHRCRYWFRVANFAYVWPSVLWGLSGERFDVVHTHAFGHAHSFFGALVAKVKGIPHVHTTHCCWTDAHRSLLGRAAMFVSYRTFGRLTFRWAKKIIAITPWEISYIKRWGGRENQIEVIPNGMDKMFFEKVVPNKFKEKHGIKNRMVLFFGRLNVTKGPDKLVQAAHKLLKNYSDVDFVILGPDEGLKEEVKRLIGGEKRIHLLGPLQDRKDVVEMYQAAD
ncbi:MAG: glycosyltransferase family 4 protein, partial [archaeon]